MSQTASPAPLPELGPIGRERFDREVRPANQPVVLRGLAAAWPAVAAARRSSDALVDYLRRFTTPRPVTAVVGEPAIDGRFFYTPDLSALNFTRGRSTLGPVLDRLLRDRSDPRPHAIAIQSEPVRELLPGFAEENAAEIVDARVPPRTWIGNRIRVATHYDLQENVGVVVGGRRRFTLFPPEQVANMYAGPLELTPAGTPVSLVDPLAPDLARFPRFAAAMAAARTATLEPGDAIYIPYHWWHAVDSLETVNLFVNYWWDDRGAGLGSPYDALLHAIWAIRNLPAERRAVWERTFAHYVFRSDGDAADHLPEPVRGVLGAPTPTVLGRMRAMLAQALGRS